MNRKMISKAISNIDDAMIAETLSSPVGNAARTPERTATMHHKRKSTRQLFRLILAACLVFAMAMTAFAFNFLGIREMLSRKGQELPEAATPYIQEHTETADGEDWCARITESLCDESKIMVTVTVSGGDKYIIAPTDADPDTLAVNIGIEGDLTLGEYAKQQGKQLLFVGATLKDKSNESFGGHGSQHFEHPSDNEMAILVQADAWAAEEDIICHVYAVDETWEKQTLELPITLAAAPSDGSATYIPVEPDAIPGLTVGNATITETPLGITVRYMETITDEDAFYNIMKVEFDGLVYGDGGTVQENDGNCYLTVSGCKGTLGDTLTVRYYNWNSEPIGELVFHKK